MRVNCVPMTSTSPLVGRSMPASRFNSVDLPEPLGPMSARKSPWCNSRSTSSNATTSNPSRLKRLLTLRTLTIGLDIVVFHPQSTDYTKKNGTFLLIELLLDRHLAIYRRRRSLQFHCHSTHRELHKRRLALRLYGSFAARPCCPLQQKRARCCRPLRPRFLERAHAPQLCRQLMRVCRKGS